MRVRAPASIANMGPGFDCMAMAIDLWLEVEAAKAVPASDRAIAVASAVL